MKSHFSLLEKIRLLWLLPLLLLPLLRCSAPQIYPQGTLTHQILSARPNYDGKLTNQTCQIYQGGKCVTEHVETYDLTQQSVQDEFTSLNFICKVGGDRYKICMHNAAPGFCHVTYSGNWFTGIFGGDQQVITFIPLEPYQRIIDSGVKCFSESVYSWEEVQ